MDKLGFKEGDFDYLLANPPFGVDWKGEKAEIDRWPDFRGYNGKLPRINDGALLFLLHMIAKFQPWQQGNRTLKASNPGIVIHQQITRYNTGIRIRNCIFRNKFDTKGYIVCTDSQIRARKRVKG